MSKTIALGFLILLTGVKLLSAQTAQQSILFLYEESNENIDPWIQRISQGLSERGISYQARAAADIDAADLEDTQRILLFGSVMGFTLSEPLRAWLNSEPEIKGKEVVLLVTAGRWFLDRYTLQLTERLNQNEAMVIDAVASVTEELTDQQKDQLVTQALLSLE